MEKNERLVFLLFSCVLCILILLGSRNGLTNADFYAKETANWRAQSIGQDMINVFIICPVLLITSLVQFLKKKYSVFLWAGTLLYLIYTYVIYCFNIHFNNYFIIYCLILGLSFYLFIYVIYSRTQVWNFNVQEKKTGRLNATYFFIISIAFYLLWLLDIAPAILNNTIPDGVREGGLFTNPVQIIDLSVFLPGIFIAGILLLKQKPLGHLFAIILLTFFILMDVTIALLTIIMVKEGVGSGITVAYVMMFLALLSLILLVRTLKVANN